MVFFPALYRPLGCYQTAYHIQKHKDTTTIILLKNVYAIFVPYTSLKYSTNNLR